MGSRTRYGWPMLAVLALAGCGQGPGEFTATACEPGPGEPFATSGLVLQEVEALPYSRTERTVVALDDERYQVDGDGVLVQDWPGVEGSVYHPVNIAQYGLYLIESHRVSGSEEHLDRAVANARALVAGATVGADGELWFGYQFDHRLRGDDDQLMVAPWYSGMAQGQALSLLTRLAEETGEPGWEDAARATYRSFEGELSVGEPHFRLEADTGCLWFEEYVDDQVEPTHVVNGHIYVMFGLYDYAQAFDEPSAVALFDAGATTVRESFDSFRVPGELSYYCAAPYCAQTRWQPPDYHRGVTAQLDTLAAMTGDETFAQMATTLRQDYAESGATG